MKVIHVMTKNNDHVCDTHFGLSSLLVTFLSVLKWKSFGYKVKLYVDEHFKQVFQDYGLLELYDEVDDTYFTDNDLYETFDIDKEYFWAFSKLFIYMKEKDNFIMSDLDFIPLQDFHNIIDENKNYIYYREVLDELTYPNELLTFSDYVYPEWLTWKEKPVNTAITYLSNEELKKLYTEEAIRFAQHNTEESDDKGMNLTNRMVFVEQRLLSECSNYLNIELTDIKSNYETICNPREIHYFCYKQMDDKNPHNWVMFFLDKLYKEFPEVYAKVIERPEYLEYKELIANEGFNFKTPKALLRTQW
jgi:hypothetical protein